MYAHVYVRTCTYLLPIRLLLLLSALTMSCAFPLHRLILIAEKDTVYEKFPTPLINRLEKHFVLTSSILEDWQEQVLKDFEEWIRDFSDTGYDMAEASFAVKPNHRSVIRGVVYFNKGYGIGTCGPSFLGRIVLAKTKLQGIILG